MKNSFKFFAPPPVGMTLTTFAAMLFTFFLFSSCQRDGTEATADKTVATSKAESRNHCGLLGYCDFTIVAINASSIEVCGDITSTVSGCNFGCNKLSDDRYAAIVLAASDFVVYCVNMDGAICIRNSATATSDAELQVFFEGTSTPVNVIIPPGEVRCFRTNSTCATINTCN